MKPGTLNVCAFDIRRLPNMGKPRQGLYRRTTE